MEHVGVELITVDGFYGEVTITLNEFYAMGIAPEGMYRWTNMESSFFDVDGSGIRIAGIDAIENI